MKKLCFLYFGLVLALLISGCNTIDAESSETSPCLEKITVDNRTFSVEEINNGIRNVFNTVLYYHTNGQLHQFVNKPIEYELYFSSKQETSFPQVHIIITNAEHPLSSVQLPKLYKFGVRLTEYGLQSDFCEQSYVEPQEDWSVYLTDQTVYLGHYSMDASQITQPMHEEVSDQWKQHAEAAIRLYMNKKDFYSEDSKNLQEGKYNIYIQGFSESDVDSTIIFEHENGQMYLGQYYFVHDIAEEKAADLNHVELIKDIDAECMEYLDKLKQNAALHIVHEVTGR